MPLTRRLAGRATFFAALLVTAACSPRAPAPAIAPAPVAPAPQPGHWPVIRARAVVALDTANNEPYRAFVVGGEILRSRTDGKTFQIARLKDDRWVDEEALSRGMPPLVYRRDVTVVETHEGFLACGMSGIVFGRLPDRAWFAENTAGRMACGSSFGTYVMWRYAGGTWIRDAAHSPPAQGHAGGIFDTWPLSEGVLGFGISNQVGDTLSAPTDVMWTAGPGDPWATRASLLSGRQPEAACADPKGVVYALDARQGNTPPSLHVIDARRNRTLHVVPADHAPGKPCASDGATFVATEPAASKEEGPTLVSFDLSRRAWSKRRGAFPAGASLRSLVTTPTRFIAVAEIAERAHLFVSAPREGASSANADAQPWSELTGFGAEQAVSIEIVRADDDALVILHVDNLDRSALVRLQL